ncbi:MAG: thiamine phosphate synthase [Planctomycetaceae bacterium]|nr:thiamine phosphate synthase [Planctomycetaceae bacterium]
MNEETRNSVYRILDASANRAGEGLRTMEEIARFVLDDSKLTSEFKSQRHCLAGALKAISRVSLLQARNTGGDVGTEITGAGEYLRADLADVVAAAAARTQQSFRVLEEYTKTIDPEISAELEQIRYRCYTACAAIELRVVTHSENCRLHSSSLYVLMSCGSSHSNFKAKVEELLVGEADVIQLRDRSADDRTLISRARAGTEIARRLGKVFIMNDRADLALAADTDGVHVGQEELPVADARRIVGNRLVGVSTHSIQQARDAVKDGADYIGCGPVFSSKTKCFTEFVGTEFLTQVVDEIQIPAFAIGGIDLTNVDQVVRSGMHRIAVTGAIRDSDHPVGVAQQLKSVLNAAVAAADKPEDPR